MKALISKAHDLLKPLLIHQCTAVQRKRLRLHKQIFRIQWPLGQTKQHACKRRKVSIIRSWGKASQKYIRHSFYKKNEFHFISRLLHLYYVTVCAYKGLYTNVGFFTDRYAFQTIHISDASLNSKKKFFKFSGTDWNLRSKSRCHLHKWNVVGPFISIPVASALPSLKGAAFVRKAQQDFESCKWKRQHQITRAR